MNLQDLIYFNCLAQTLNFTQTAEKFYVSQPSISTSLKRLEKELETVLIDRKDGHKSLKLTESGNILFKHSIDILQKIEKIKEDIYTSKNQIVYFGLLPTIGSYFLPELNPYISKFSQSMKFIEEESSDVMIDLVRKGEVPIAIVGSDQPSFSEDQLLQIPLLTQEFSLWGSPSHRLAGKENVNLKDIEEEIFISLSEEYTHHRIFEKWAKDKLLKYPQTLYTKEIRTALTMASTTQMLSFLIGILVNENKNLTRIPIEDAPKFYISLVINTDIETTSLQKEFNDTLIEFAEQYPRSNQ